MSNLPHLLADELRGFLYQVGYENRIENNIGYTLVAAQTIHQQIQCYLKELAVQDPSSIKASLPDYLYFFNVEFAADDPDQTTPIIRDLDWELIKQHFFTTLIKENYFNIQIPATRSL